MWKTSGSARDKIAKVIWVMYTWFKPTEMVNMTS
jgi:hypothetical protein